MPDPTFIPGYLGTLTINSEEVSATGNVMTLNFNKNVMTKPVFGNPWGFSLGGQKTATLTASGHVSAEQYEALVALFNSDTPLEASLQIGEASGATDAGLHTGKINISSFSVTGNADGEFDWSLGGTFTGAVGHTPGGSS